MHTLVLCIEQPAKELVYMTEKIQFKELTDLNFTCEPGDLIWARNRAIMIGTQSFSISSWSVNGYNDLGDDVLDVTKFGAIPIELCTQLLPCLVTAKYVFPVQASNLNYLELMHNGRVGRIFDDPANGLWIPCDVIADKKMLKASNYAWVERAAGTIPNDARTCTLKSQAGVCSRFCNHKSTIAIGS